MAKQSLADLLEQVQKRAKEEVPAEIEKLKQKVADIRAKAEAAVQAEIEEMNRLDAVYFSATGEHVLPQEKQAPKQKASKGSRTRRSGEEVIAEATEAADWLKSKGKTGATGGELREKFPGLGPVIRDHLEKYAKVKVLKTGDKATARWFHPDTAPKDAE